MQIERHFAVKVIPLHGLVEFGNFEELVHVEPIPNPSQHFSYAVYQSRFEQQPPNYETNHQTQEYQEYDVVTSHDSKIQFLQLGFHHYIVSSVPARLGEKKKITFSFW